MAVTRSPVSAERFAAGNTVRMFLLRLRESNWLAGVLVVAGGWALATFVTTFSSYFVVIAALAIVLGLLFIRNLQLGMFIYVVIAALAFGESPGLQSPHSTYKAGLLPCEILLGFLAMLWLGRALFGDGPKLVPSRMNLPMLALGASAVVSLITNNVFRGTRELLFHQLLITQVAEVGLLWFSITAFFMAANTWRDAKWLQRLFIPIVLYGVYFAAHRIFRFALPVPIIWGSLLLSAAIAFVYARLLFSKLSRGALAAHILLLGIMLVACFKSLAWVSGWVAAMAALTVVSFYRSKMLVGLLVILMLFAMFVWPGVYHEVHIESEEGGDFDRFTIWRDAFEMFLNVSPVFGVGPGNYHPYVYYHNTLWFGGRTYTTAHSNYVQMAAELGLLGLTVFIWVIIAGIRAGNDAVRRGPPELKWLSVAATAIFASIAFASLMGDYMFPSRGNNGIVNFGTTVYTWLILGAAVAAANLPHDSEQDTAEVSSTHGT